MISVELTNCRVSGGRVSGGNRKNHNFLFLIRLKLEFKLDLNIIESKFPIDFQGPTTKKFTKIGYFCDAIPYY